MYHSRAASACSRIFHAHCIRFAMSPLGFGCWSMSAWVGRSECTVAGRPHCSPLSNYCRYNTVARRQGGLWARACSTRPPQCRRLSSLAHIENKTLTRSGYSAERGVFIDTLRCRRRRLESKVVRQHSDRLANVTCRSFRSRWSVTCIVVVRVEFASNLVGRWIVIVLTIPGTGHWRRSFCS